MNWTYKITNINMPADYMEITVEYTSPNGQVFQKMYSFMQAKTEQEIKDFIVGRINELETLRVSYENLMIIVDQVQMV